MRPLSAFRASSPVALAFVSSVVPLLFGLVAACGSSDSAKKTSDDGGTPDATASGSGGRSGTGGNRSSGGSPAASGGARSTGGNATSSGGSTGTPEAGPDAATTPDGSTDASAPDSSAVACTDFTPDVTTASTGVRFVNATNDPIYLGPTTKGCAFDIGFTAEDAQGQPLKLARDDCELSCEDMQQSCGDCTPFCHVQVVTLIAPGGYYEIGWPGTVFTTEHMPAKCLTDGSCAGDACYVERAATPGAVTIKGTVYPQPVCPNGPCTLCTPGAGQKNCTVFGAETVTGAKKEVTATWNGSGTVMLTFDAPDAG